MKEKRCKYIFVVGGVMSGVGKGVTASSISVILKGRGLVVTALKIDPYINVDAGTMNPTEHGEVFVLNTGLETDQDMGNYERFLNTELPPMNYMTTGSVYRRVIEKERNLEYKGRNVQVVPDVPLEVIARIEAAADKAKADVAVVEIGGTVGEYENILFLEAARMMHIKHPDDVAFVMVTYLPVPSKLGEMKTKPTQHASRTLGSAGIQADIIIARADAPLDEKRKEKIALFCNIRPECVISAPDVESIYDVPLNFEKDGLSALLCTQLSLSCSASDLSEWKRFVEKTKRPKKEVRIAVVGKYFSSGDFVLSDVYLSVLEAIKFSAYHQGARPVIEWLDSVAFEKDPKKLRELSRFGGVLIPGGFGSRGIDGKLRVIEYVRKKKIPYFGLCYGMQLLVIEYARNVLGLQGAHTVEIDSSTAHPVIGLMPDQRALVDRGEYGGTMRLGSYPCVLKKGTRAAKAYGREKIVERHRHRYEVNPEYIAELENAGLIFSGTSPDKKLMEIAELPRKEHPFFLGTQFHPEFHARPLAPHPLFDAFVKAALQK